MGEEWNVKIGEIISHKELFTSGMNNKNNNNNNNPNNIEKEGKTLSYYQRQYEYCAPELFYENITQSSSTYSNRIDVYSTAVIFWEIVHRAITGKYEKPYSEFGYSFEFQTVLQTSKRNIRPSLPPSTPAPIAELIKRCWNKDPSMRPDLPSIKKNICIIERDYLLNISHWNSLLANPSSSS